MEKHHSLFYITEFAVISGGFSLILVGGFSFYLQLAILLLIFIFYTSIGLYHHKTHHDITSKVVLEYILISALMAALFVFLNLTKF